MLCTVLLTRKMHFGILQAIKTIYLDSWRKKERCYWQKLWLKQNLFFKQRFACSREYVTKLKVRMPLGSCSCCCGEKFSSCPVSQVLLSLQSGHRSVCLSGWLANCLPACVPFAGRLLSLPQVSACRYSLYATKRSVGDFQFQLPMSGNLQGEFWVSFSTFWRRQEMLRWWKRMDQWGETFCGHCFCIMLSFSLFTDKGIVYILLCFDNYLKRMIPDSSSWFFFGRVTVSVYALENGISL